MAKRSKRESRALVASQTKAIAVLSSPLVLRGLREFPQTPRWNSKQVFPVPQRAVCISARGFAAMYSPAPRDASQRIEMCDLELTGTPTLLSVPDEPLVAYPDFPAAMAWAPSGHSLIAVSGTWQPALHFFDVRTGQFAGRFGTFHVLPAHLGWSESGNYFAAAAEGSEDSKLQLWMTAETPEKFELLRETDSNAYIKNQAEAELGDQGKFWGFGATAFRPDEKALATVIEYEGDWSDDLIVLAKVPNLKKIAQFEATGRITDLSWASDGRELIFCASGQAWTLEPRGGEIMTLPCAGEICRCHPKLPLCAFFNSWLKSSAKGRIFIADLARKEIVDECQADGILDMCWSQDGRTLYAVARDGMAYLYERNIP